MHHRYEIVEKATGKVDKTGISGQKLNKNGTSPRANKQVNKLNKEARANGEVGPNEDKYEARIPEKDIPGREAALKSEQDATNRLHADGHPPELQELPQPQPIEPQAGGSP